MSIRAKLFFCGEERDLLETNLTCERKTWKNGKPKSVVLGGVITVLFEAQMYDESFMDATMIHRFRDEKLQYWQQLYKLYNGKIVFYKDDECTIELFQYNFKDAIIIEYEERFDCEHGAFVAMTISPAMLDYRYFENGKGWSEYSTTRYIKPWQESYIPPADPKPYKASTANRPSINRVKWVDKDNNVINDISYEDELGLEIDLNNPNGETAKIVITKKDTTNFDETTKEITFEEKVTGSKINIANIHIKKEWEDFKKATVDELVATVTYFDSTQKSSLLEIVPAPKVTVGFRPNEFYDGEYGFDYMRDMNKYDFVTYKDILQTVKDGKLVPDTGARYQALKDTEYQTLAFPWNKDDKGKQREYIQSWLTIYPKQEVLLSLQIETFHIHKDVEVCLEYDNKLFKVNTDSISLKANKNYSERLEDIIKLTCLEEFDTNQTIKVMYGNQQLGQLNIIANAKSKRKKVEVVFVEVTTELYRDKPKYANTINTTGKSEKEMLTKYLKQAYTSVSVTEVEFDITQKDPITQQPKYPNFNKDYSLIDVTNSKRPKILNKNHNNGGENLAAFMETIFNKENPTYSNHFKIFFFGDIGGRKDKKTRIKKIRGFAKDINTKSAVIFNRKRKATVVHELLHCTGLRHSFSKKGTFIYSEKDTENIMDYSITRKHLWLWQWKQLWKNKNLQNE